MPELIESPIRVEAAGEREAGELEVTAGQAVLVRGGERVRHSTPGGAEYIAICLPAFSPDTVHRDA